MTDTLLQSYLETFRTTDARSVVKYDDLMNMLEDAGFTDEYCAAEMKKAEEFQKKAFKKLSEIQNAGQQPDLEEIFKDAPKPDEQKVEIFETRFIQLVKDDMSLILLTTL